MEQQVKNYAPALKVCGLTRIDDASFCQRLRVEYLGFNFYPGSKRFIQPEHARQLWLQGLALNGLQFGFAASQAVGVFVGARLPEIQETLRHFPELSVLQVQGDYPSEFYQDLVATIGPRMIWQVKHATNSLLHFYLPTGVSMLLIDSATVPQGASVPGGSGQMFDWSSLASLPAGVAFGVAGGIKPGCWQALAAYKPQLIDVCSGVEQAPGKKDHDKIAALLAELRQGGL